MVKSSNIRNKFDLKDVARILGVSYITASKLCRDNEIKSTKIGQKVYVERRDLNEYMDTGDIFQKPQKVILDTINQAVKEATEKNIGQINEAIQLTFIKNIPFLAHKVKELIIKDLTKIMTERFKQIDENNKQFSGRIAEQLKGREKVIKKDFEETKKM